MDKPIIILGSERSGTNLLRHLLSNHSKICGPVTPQFLDVFFPIVHLYGDLRDCENIKYLYNDMVALANHQFHDWALKKDFKDFLGRYNPTNIVELFNYLYLEKAAQENKSRYVAKDIHAWLQAHKIKNIYPSARFIYIVRDPRDHVNSWMKRPIYLHTPLDAIKKWKKDQKEIMQIYYAEGIEWHLVRYEDLITKTSKTMSGLLQYLGEEKELDCFETQKENAKESKWNDYWKNLGRKIDKNNKGNYRDYLEEEDIELIETYCYSEMQHFGYEAVTRQAWRPTYRYKIKMFRKKRESMQRRKTVTEKWQNYFDSRQIEINAIKNNAYKRWKAANVHVDTKVKPRNILPRFFTL